MYNLFYILYILCISMYNIICEKETSSGRVRVYVCVKTICGRACYNDDHRCYLCARRGVLSCYFYFLVYNVVMVCAPRADVVVVVVGVMYFNNACKL